MFLYNQANNDLLYTISEIFYNEENVEERINLYNDKSKELKEISDKIIENGLNLLDKNEKYNLYNIIPQDNNRINIDKILDKLIIIIGKNLVFLEKYKEAREFYQEKKMITEAGMICLKYEKNYEKAFEIFDSISNYKYALDSLKLLKNYTELLYYTNKIASYLGIISYNDIYIKYTNLYFSSFLIKRKKLFEEKYLHFIEDKTEKGLVNFNLIKNFFKIYLDQISVLQKEEIFKIFKDKEISMNNIILSNNDSLEEKIEEFKEELKMNQSSIDFIDTYYFGKLKNILLELINIFPELIVFSTNYFNIEKHFRRRIFIKLFSHNKKYINDNKDLWKRNDIVFENKYRLEKNIIIIIDYIINNCKYKSEDSEDIFYKYIIPFLMNHGYFYYKLDKYFHSNSFKVELFFDLALNKYELISNLIHSTEIRFLITNNNNFFLYYACYVLRL